MGRCPGRGRGRQWAGWGGGSSGGAGDARYGAAPLRWLLDQAVGDIAAGGLTGSDDLHDLSSLDPKVACYWVPGLDPGQLALTKLVSGQQLRHLLLGHDHMLRDQLVLRDVDEQLLLQELLQDVLGGHVHQGLLGGRRHALLHHDQRPRDVLLLHALAVHLDGLDAHLGLLWEEHKHLVCGVVIVGHQHGEVCAPRSPFARFVAKLCLELLECLVQLILGHQVATVMTKLHDGLADLPEPVRLNWQNLARSPQN